LNNEIEWEFCNGYAIGKTTHANDTSIEQCNWRMNMMGCGRETMHASARGLTMSK
jgi:hypothetical protein